MILLFELRWGEKGERQFICGGCGEGEGFFFKKKKRERKKGSNELKWIKVNRDI